jgi:uncharacterized sodium:solute symporter family permease YidK
MLLMTVPTCSPFSYRLYGAVGLFVSWSNYAVTVGLQAVATQDFPNDLDISIGGILMLLALALLLLALALLTNQLKRKVSSQCTTDFTHHMDRRR